MSEVALPAVAERVTVGEAGERLIRQLATRGRKVSTLAAYRTHLRVHLAPHFGDRPLARIGKDEVEEFMLVCLERGQSAKSVRNYLGFLHGIFEYALREGWVIANPCRTAEKPAAPDTDPDIHFLDQSELDALLAATINPYGHRRPDTPARSRRVKALRDVEHMTWKAIAAELEVAESTAIYLYRVEPEADERDDALGRVDRALYLTAAMTGMRQGELFALRWMDVDWLAHRVRVRRNYVHGRFGTPKSERGHHRPATPAGVDHQDRIRSRPPAAHRGGMALPPASEPRQSPRRTAGRPAPGSYRDLLEGAAAAASHLGPARGASQAPHADRGRRRPRARRVLLGDHPDRVNPDPISEHPVGWVGGGPATRGEPATRL